MPHTEHRKKTQRKAQEAREVNRARRSAARTALKKAREAVESPEGLKDLRPAHKAIDKAAQYGVYHRNKAARLKSRLSRAANRAKPAAAK
jgi:small subunit ribosomal protein S20